MDAIFPPSSALRLDDSYRPLPSLYLTLLCFWFLSTLFWAFLNYRNRHSQMSNLQWTLAAVPIIKALQLTLSFFFWYSCFYLERCSLWMSFGMYVMGVLFQTASFISFFIISNGYCITCERLSLTERRTTAVLGCVFYLTLVGYRASIPYFAVLLLLNYFVSFYTIFYRISRNLSVLWQQLSFIEDEGADAMHDVVYTKYIMFKKFQIVMHMVAMSEIIVYGTMDDSVENYWLRLSVRESGLLCFFLYIGWIFRSQNLPRFSVMPTVKSNADITIPPIYSIEMDAATFRDIRRLKWHIGVPTLHSGDASSRDPILVIL